MIEIENKKQKALDYAKSAMPLFIDVCEPLSLLGIKAFSYIKCSAQGQYVTYSNIENAVIHHIQNVDETSPYFQNMAMQCPGPLKKFSLTGLLSEEVRKKDPTLGILWENDLWNARGLYDMSNQDYAEGWIFGLGKANENAENFFIAQEHLLKRFMTYFKATVPELCDISDAKKCAKYHKSFSFLDLSKEDVFHNTVLEFLQKTGLKKLDFMTDMGEIRLTKRQAQCLYYLNKHHSVKEIAKLLDLSPRTVESYLQTLKDQLHISSKGDLLSFIKKHALDEKLPLFIA